MGETKLVSQKPFKWTSFLKIQSLKSTEFHTILHSPKNNLINNSSIWITSGIIAQVDLSQLTNRQGIIPPRPFIVEFKGTQDDLVNEFKNLEGLSIEGVRKVPIPKNEENDDSEQEYTFYVLVQLYGHIAIPMKNLQSAFIKPEPQKTYKRTTIQIEDFLMGKLKSKL